MYWKMSIDLSRPLVASMGQHDPLDGFVTCAELDATACALGSGGSRTTPIRGKDGFRGHDRDRHAHDRIRSGSADCSAMRSASSSSPSNAR